MIAVFIFILGAFIGSFLNVLADRLPKGEQVIKGRSYCDHCKKKLSPFDLVPVLSYLFLRGQCRSCHKKISVKYPLVELATGLGFAYLYSHSASIFLFILFSILVVIFMSDLQYLIIPNTVVIPGIFLVLVYKFLYSPQSLITAIITALGAFLFLYFLYLVTRGRGMGFGDVKFSLLMGLLLGFPEIVIAFYIAFLTGAFVSLILLLLGRVHFGQQIPFGPFLVLATIITYLWRENLLTLFLKLLF